MEDKEDHSKRPEDTNFKQQRLKAWQPLLTPPWVIGTFFVVGIIFIPIGVVIFNASDNVKEVRLTYDDGKAGAVCKNYGEMCMVTMDVNDKMTAPVYFYYELQNFYQNHRRYVKSRSDTQTAQSGSPTDTANCDPLTSGLAGKDLYPCGLIAASFFNDTYGCPLGNPQCTFNCIKGAADEGVRCRVQLTNLNDATNPVTVDSSNIAWASDLDKKFADKGDPSDITTVTNHADLTRVTAGNVTLPHVTDQHFMVWMRTAGLPTFRKLWGKIDSDIPAGARLQFFIDNQFRVSGFNGQKAIVLSTTSWLGGKNDFLGIAYMAVGALCFVLGFVFLIKHLVSPRVLGDMHYLNLPSATGAATTAATH